MKKSKLFVFSALLLCAFAFASCGAAGEKAKEEAKSECKHDKDHKCDSVKMDSCKHADTDTTVVETQQVEEN